MLTPRAILLLLIGFIGGLSVSFIRLSLASWGPSVGFRIPRSYSTSRSTFDTTTTSTTSSSSSQRKNNKGISRAPAEEDNGNENTNEGTVSTKQGSKSKFTVPSGEGSSGSGSTSTNGNNGNGGKTITANGKTVIRPLSSSLNSKNQLSPEAQAARTDLPLICNNSEPMTEGPRGWHIFSQDELDETVYPCYWTNLTHWQLKHYHKVGPIKMCTHDPTVDTVISSHLHKYGFWGSPDEFMILLSTGPCSEERPYMLDIGGNIGLFSLLGAYRGCRILAFEPLSDNIQRFSHSVIANGWWDRVKLFKHAVGKYFTTVTIGFRPSNPGSSGINLGGAKSERMDQITIDGLLLGHSPPSFGKDFPPIDGSRINFIKVDTEGYDVAVISGMLRTLIDGKVPHMLIEFSPGDAAGTAGCNPVNFVTMMYENGYTMYEYAKPVDFRHLVDVMIPTALAGKGRRVFESWFILNEVADRLLKNGKLRNEN